jgi:hypothetical protein
MAPGGVMPVLSGRSEECARLDRAVAVVRSSEGQLLVQHPEVGNGKSRLLEYLFMNADECLVERVAGAESDMALVFARLHPYVRKGLTELGITSRRQLWAVPS